MLLHYQIKYAILQCPAMLSTVNCNDFNLKQHLRILAANEIHNKIYFLIHAKISFQNAKCRSRFTRASSEVLSNWKPNVLNQFIIGIARKYKAWFDNRAAGEQLKFFFLKQTNNRRWRNKTKRYKQKAYAFPVATDEKFSGHCFFVFGLDWEECRRMCCCCKNALE